MTTTKKSSDKKYHLTEGEIKNIKFRRMSVDYLIDSANNEMGSYIYSQIRPRLGIKDNAKLELSEDGEWIIEVPEIIV